MGASELREIYLKTDNYIKGEYFARLIKVTSRWRTRDTDNCTVNPPFRAGSCGPLAAEIRQKIKNRHITQLLLCKNCPNFLWSISGGGQRAGGEQVPARRAPPVHLRTLHQRVGEPGQLVHPAQGPLTQHEVDDPGSQDLVRALKPPISAEVSIFTLKVDCWLQDPVRRKFYSKLVKYL